MDFLTDLYIDGEDTYAIEEGDRLRTVIVDRNKYELTAEALKNFEAVHDEWEMNICEKHPHDALIGGMLSLQ